MTGAVADKLLGDRLARMIETKRLQDRVWRLEAELAIARRALNKHINDNKKEN